MCTEGSRGNQERTWVLKVGQERSKKKRGGRHSGLKGHFQEGVKNHVTLEDGKKVCVAVTEGKCKGWAMISHWAHKQQPLSCSQFCGLRYPPGSSGQVAYSLWCCLGSSTCLQSSKISWGCLGLTASLKCLVVCAACQLGVSLHMPLILQDAA